MRVVAAPRVTVLFGDLAPGDTFRTDGDPAVFMKHMGTSGSNSVRLANGDVCYLFAASTRVTRVNGIFQELP